MHIYSHMLARIYIKFLCLIILVRPKGMENKGRRNSFQCISFMAFEL